MACDFVLAGQDLGQEAAPKTVTALGQSLVPNLALETDTVQGQVHAQGQDLPRTTGIRAAAGVGQEAEASLQIRTGQTGAVAGLESLRTMEKRYLLWMKTV